MSTAERDEGTPDAEGEHRFFIHGTTRQLWRGDTIDPSRGSGDFGAGFYVFEDTSWGRQAAAIWARRKAWGGDEPILVRVRIARSEFEALDRQDVPAESFTEVRRQYARYGLTQAGDRRAGRAARAGR